MNIKSQIEKTIQSFSLAEKIVFYFFVIVLAISSVTLLWQVNKQFLTERPDYGGSLMEGVTGNPRFVNPVLAVSDSDKDLSALIYSGLLRAKADGSLIPDLAKSYTVSEDGLTYTFVLKNNITFHDGSKLTADDVLFTIEKAQDPTLKSPRKASWDGVSVEKIDDQTIEFTLKTPYGGFLQNTTLGILPKHIWKDTTDEEFPFSQYNIKPVGSGPYKIDNIVLSDGGLPKEYKLSSFKKYALGEAYISNITIKSYPDQAAIINAYKNGDIESLYGISAKTLESLNSKNSPQLEKSNITLSPLPRVFGVFFNQNVSPVLLNKEVRQALEAATDKDEIIKEVLGGYGQAIDEPLPPNRVDVDLITPNDTDDTSASTSSDYVNTNRVVNAKNILEKAGWKQNASGIYEKKEKDKKNPTLLSFSISTSDAPDLKAVAEILQRQWQSIGAQVTVKIFEVSDLNQNIIRPRKYDALLFGEIVGKSTDLYPFWHSSERNDPGLNIAMYTNLKADKILETLRQTVDQDKQQSLYSDLIKEIQNDRPAIFIYSPYFLYVAPNKIHNISLGVLSSPNERFGNVNEWYIETSSVWKIFQN